MKNEAFQPIEMEDDATGDLLDALVSAHYLALKMRMLIQDEAFQGREATGLLADALTEWARLVEDDLFAEPDRAGRPEVPAAFAALPDSPKH
jgi:hypothetical protein